MNLARQISRRLDRAMGTRTRSAAEYSITATQWCLTLWRLEYYDKITTVNRELMRPRTEEATAALYCKLFAEMMD